jgi:hypothetical protein
MEDFTLLSIGARFKKWELSTPVLPKGHISKQPPKKIQKNQKNLEKRPNPLSVRLRATAGGRPLADQSLTDGRTTRAGRRPAVTCRPHAGSIFSLLPLLFSPSSPTFGHFGQLHLIGSSPCPPYPDF